MGRLPTAKLANTTCSYCGNLFYKEPKFKRVSKHDFCNRTCYKIWKIKNRKCLLCKTDFHPLNIDQKYCSNKCEANSLRKGNWSGTDYKSTCKFCGKKCKNINSLIGHERFCKKNANKRESPFVKYHQNKTSPFSWNKGLDKSDPRIQKSINTARQNILNGLVTPSRTKHTDEWKREQRERKLLLYETGWEPICGRCKKYNYESPIAGKIKVDGTWELKVAQYLDSINVIWKRNKKRFPYTRQNGKNSTYQPDFYIEDWNTYLEVKGYETELDRCKWAQFTEPLIMWRGKEIEEIDKKS